MSTTANPASPRRNLRRDRRGAVLVLFGILIIVIFIIIAMYEIGLKLGKSGAFVLLAIFVPIVWMIWLAFDSSTWPGKKAVATAGAAKAATTKKNTTEE